MCLGFQGFLMLMSGLQVGWHRVTYDEEPRFTIFLKESIKEKSVRVEQLQYNIKVRNTYSQPFLSNHLKKFTSPA